MSPEIKKISFEGYSMYPNLRPGDILIVKGVDGASGEVKLGDIICFPKGGGYVAHRIIDISEGGKTFTTKGDNMVSPDTPRAFKDNSILKVIIIKRPKKGLIKPRYGRFISRMSSINLTFGIVKGRIGRWVKRSIGLNFWFIRLMRT